MTKLKWALVLSALTIAAGLKTTMPATALEGHDCSDASPAAVIKLPAPLSKWGQITCTPLGQMLTSHEGWIWIMPDASGTVLIPAQEIQSAKEASGAESYFTKIDLAQVKGKDFDSVYGAFHAGFDDKEVKPEAYRVDLITASGKDILLFFFDYGNYAWGITCPGNKCDTETRFMILDKNHKPEPRQPAI